MLPLADARSDYIFLDCVVSLDRVGECDMGMGPVLIFDKSTLQSLSTREAVWLDNFYLCNITPLFFIETLADIEKSVHRGRTPEQVVGNLAHKTPDYGSCVNAVHTYLLEGELSAGANVDMRYGRPVRVRASGSCWADKQE